MKNKYLKVILLFFQACLLAVAFYKALPVGKELLTFLNIDYSNWSYNIKTILKLFYWGFIGTIIIYKLYEEIMLLKGAVYCKIYPGLKMCSPSNKYIFQDFTESIKNELKQYFNKNTFDYKLHMENGYGNFSIEIKPNSLVGANEETLKVNFDTIYYHVIQDFLKYSNNVFMTLVENPYNQMRNKINSEQLEKGLERIKKNASIFNKGDRKKVITLKGIEKQSFIEDLAADLINKLYGKSKKSSIKNYIKLHNQKWKFLTFSNSAIKLYWSHSAYTEEYVLIDNQFYIKNENGTKILIEYAPSENGMVTDGNKSTKKYLKEISEESSFLKCCKSEFDKIEASKKRKLFLTRIERHKKLDQQMLEKTWQRYLMKIC